VFGSVFICFFTGVLTGLFNLFGSCFCSILELFEKDIIWSFLEVLEMELSLPFSPESKGAILSCFEPEE
jgi:hypothetical protein